MKKIYFIAMVLLAAINTNLEKTEKEELVKEDL